MPPTVTEGIDWTALILWVTTALCAIIAFFLVRAFGLLDRVVEKLNAHDVLLAVHGEKHDRHDERIDALEVRKK